MPIVGGFLLWVCFTVFFGFLLVVYVVARCCVGCYGMSLDLLVLWLDCGASCLFAGVLVFSL